MTNTYSSYLGRIFVSIGLGLTIYGQQIPRADLPAALASHTAHLANEAAPPLNPSPALIVRSFLAAETTFRETATHFSFKRDVVLQTIGADGAVTGEYIRDSLFILDDRGERFERVLYHPQPSIKAMKITKEDIQDLAGSQLFGLEAADLKPENLAFAGREDVNGHPAYRLSISGNRAADRNNPRARYFVGVIWIDQISFQIVKLRGTTEPQGKQRFPMFETVRDTRVETQRFPSTTSADDVLHFPHADVHYRISVRYYDFKRFASRLKIVEVDG